MPLISIIVPVYNRADTIAAAVHSVLRQSFRDFEVIVVDDGSSDGTVAAVEAINDPRLRLVRRMRNGGGAAARNTGIREAQGSWIAFQDSDDEWLPLKLERQVTLLDRSSADTIGVYCGMIILGRPHDDDYDPSALQYRPPTLPGVSLEGDLHVPLLTKGSLISTQVFMGRKDALLAVGGFDEELHALQDWDCFIRLAQLGPIAFEPEPLVLQRFSGNSLTRSSRNRAAALARILEKNAVELGPMPQAHALHLYRLAGMYRRLGRPHQARNTLLQALRLDPRNPRLWAGLTRAFAANCREALRNPSPQPER